MNIKYLFFDIDGTLAGKSRRITSETRQAIAKARRLGHKVFLCTGRAPVSIVGDAKELEVDGMVCGAGSFIKIGNRFIYEHYLDRKLLSEVMQLFREHHIMFKLESKDIVYQTGGLQEFFDARHAKRIKMNAELARFRDLLKLGEKRRPICFFDIKRIGVAKIVFVAKDKKEFEACVPELEKNFNIVIFSKPEEAAMNGEIILKTCTKGDGIRRVMDYYHADIADSIGFGDSMNDYQMLETTGSGAVFEGAQEKLKELAQYYFCEPDEGGISQVMAQMGLLG